MQITLCWLTIPLTKPDLYFRCLYEETASQIRIVEVILVEIIWLRGCLGIAFESFGFMFHTLRAEGYIK